jgi:peptidoglycan lytic transglycosylase
VAKSRLLNTSVAFVILLALLLSGCGGSRRSKSDSKTQRIRKSTHRRFSGYRPMRKQVAPPEIKITVAEAVPGKQEPVKAREVITGKASYYGPRYHGRLTANGEKFNRHALSAAHASFPFGARLLVTNLANERRVTVRINDRFPGTKGRIIDLSEAAFRRISPLSVGVIDVRLEVLP